MFTKLLIANRGEIACRIIKTARALGIETIAIYSTADKNSLHVQQADKAYWVGEAASKQSYLNTEAIIEVAKKTGAKAIHPGYGFLSENPAFAKACEDNAIVFIGPSIKAMQIMASKQIAKELLEKSVVPLTPGYHGHDQADSTLLKEAKRIGFPVLLKAANGGGGKGMRAVYEETSFHEALAGARREAQASFADELMIIEKLLLNPRHIEIQIMADTFGNVVHLFERDCSIQRRHQKIIEEAPAPHLSQRLRQQLSEAACEVARSIAYQGAGTVEFLLDSDEQFYFMEMNTRLQVEHPVTEMITGLDLVAWQLDIAAGNPLPLSQENIKCNGHAIECRIYAEDPDNQFIPSIGQISFLKEPEGPGIRIDSGVQCHSHISQYYDPMIAKLIVHGDTREIAHQRLLLALKQYAIAGVTSNLPFLQAICAHPIFALGKSTTSFLQNHSLSMAKPDSTLALLMTASFDYLSLYTKENDPLYRSHIGWQMHTQSQWIWQYQLDHSTHAIRITPVDQHHLTLQLDEQLFSLGVYCKKEQLILDDGKEMHTLWFQNVGSKLTLFFPERPLSVHRFSLQQIDSSNEARHELTAPMPATVVATLKKEGDTIKKGDHLMVLEAMKMEHTICSPQDGMLVKLFYQVGEQVNEGAELLSINDGRAT